jgi:hypothetical protein
MFRLLVTSGLVALALLTLFAPTSQLFTPGMQTVPLRQVPQVPQYTGAPQQPVAFLRAGQPRMVMPAGDIAGSIVDVQTLALPTALLAKSEADELLDEFFIVFPLAFCGLIFGYAAKETAKSALDVEFPEGSEGVVTIVACLGGAVFLVLLGNSGFLGAVSGVAAKALLDGWNLIANAVLKGAILKY